MRRILPFRPFSPALRGRVLALLAAPLFLGQAGCTSLMRGKSRTEVPLQPPFVTSLDAIFAQQGKAPRPQYGYRCTAGAHRGASTELLENTLAALVAADRDDRYAFIEFDVQYTRDGRIVVFHDKRLFRIFGSLRSIGNSTYAELQELSEGEIAAYDEVMPLLHKKLNIEIKSRDDPEEDERLVDEIMADLRRRGRDRDVLLSSISPDVIRYVNRKYPEMPTGQVFWLTTSTYIHLDILTERLYEEISATQADYLMMHIANLRNIEDLLRYKPRNKTVVFWDFDDRIFIIHKDLSDRLWGDSSLHVLFRNVWYRLLSPWRSAKPKA